MTRPVCLIIRDGWGVNPSSDYQAEGDATKYAKTPVMDRILKDCPTSMLKCSGLDVGLAKGFQGNSEVGHLNLGSGRVVDEMMVRIDKSIENGSFFDNKAFQSCIDHCLRNDSTLHLMGLLQDQGVHAMNTHLYALLALAKRRKLEKVMIHIFSDGRDTPPQSAGTFIAELLDKIREIGVGTIGSLHGRYYGMDRDKRWDRVEKSYNCLVKGEGQKSGDINEALVNAYGRGETDEFIVPTIVGDFSGIKDGDAFLHFNYRLDRGRELTHAFNDKEFTFFERQKPDILYAAFSQYYEGGNYLIAFGETELHNIFAEVISKAGLSCLRIAETEKYAHVTFFFNAQKEEPFPGEERILVASPRIATYDLQPEMSALEVTEKLLEALPRFDVLVLNFANGDMVGHTGILEAAVKAVETVDSCLGKVLEKITSLGGCALVTSDHGNCEKMLDHGNRHTAHTLFDVSCSLVNYPGPKLRDGRLADVAPTLLEILRVPQPSEMTGRSLLVH
jgi:2,3-bisphosphoglycerate-independent phosphoglycerate mutase